MKRFLKYFGSALGLLVVAAFILALAQSAPLLQQEPKADPLAFTSPISPLPTPTNSIPSPIPTIRLEPGGPTPTPMPDLGVHLDTPREIRLQREAANLLNLFDATLDVSDGSLFAVARQKDGLWLVAIDVATGGIHRLTAVVNPPQPPRADKSIVAWIEPARELDRNMSRLQILDRVSGQLRTLVEGTLYQLDLKDNLLVWQEYREGSWGIYGYDINANTELVIAVGPEAHFFPRVCGQNRVAYLRSTLDGSTAELRVFNTTQGFDMAVGVVVVSKESSSGYQHACDSSRLAWVGLEKRNSGGQELVVPVQRVYDFSTENEQVLDVQTSSSVNLQLQGDTLVGIVGYDLRRNVPFNINFKPSDISMSSGHSLVAGPNWILYMFYGAQNTPPRLYIASIIRN